MVTNGNHKVVIDQLWKEGRESEDNKMIMATLVMNTHGKPRITKFHQNEVRIGPPLSSPIWPRRPSLTTIVSSSPSKQQNVIMMDS